MFGALHTRLKVLAGDKRGVTAVEYTVIAALIIGTVALGFSGLAESMSVQLGNIVTYV